MGKQSSKLKPKSITELVEQTSFTDDELKEWYQRFKSVYPDKVLTKEDFKIIYGEQFPFGDASAFSNHIFSQFDTNGDGFIDFREFMVWMSVATSSLKVEGKLKRVFSMYDLNHDGLVTRDEMMEIVATIYKMNGIVDESYSKKLVDDIFVRLDTDMDGHLSESEFIEGAKRDPDIKKILQCDWENKLIRNIDRRTSGASTTM